MRSNKKKYFEENLRYVGNTDTQHKTEIQYNQHKNENELTGDD